MTTYYKAVRPDGAGPCTDERTTPAPVSGAGLDLDASHVRTDPACPFHDGTTPPASRGKRCPACMRLDLDALHETICDNFTGMAEVRQAADLLVAEVRRLAALCIPLTDLAQELDLSRQNLHHSRAMSSAHFERAEREKARAESAEAEVRTLRAKVAEVDALPDEWEGEADANETHPKECRTLLSAASQLRAALATTGEGQ